jgi:hypothetical protein
MPMLVASKMDLKIDAALVMSKDVQTLIKNDPSKIPGHTR